MALKQLTPWHWGGLHPWEGEVRPDQLFRRDMGDFHREIDRLFDSFWRESGRPSFSPDLWALGEVAPRVDETEDETAYHVTMELPGMDEKDIEIALSDGALTIQGEKKQEEEGKGKNYYRKERSFGAFCRTFVVPGGIDESNIKAEFKKGVLRVDLPKSEEDQKKVKHIEIKSA